MMIANLKCPKCKSKDISWCDPRELPALQPRRSAYYCRSPKCGYCWPEDARAGGYRPRDLYLWGQRYYASLTEEEAEEVTGIPSAAQRKILAGMQRAGSPDIDLAMSAISAFRG